MSTAENVRAGAMERVHVPKTAEVLASTIRAQIVRGEIPEGAALPSESELVSQFGVSRSSLREAFRILESEQLITIRRGAHGGARVKRPDVTVAARYLALLLQPDGVLLAGNRTLRLLYGTLTELVRQEIIAYTIRETPGRIQSAGESVRGAMRLVAAGEGDKAADFWRGRMLSVAERVAETHGGRTIVDALTSG
ncbi:MAG TPA: GntR family transcriptional regulator [Amycolatopsis sp.]|nr:GntR family transcriptional regulator [Amycolatopsis sp.]